MTAVSLRYVAIFFNGTPVCRDIRMDIPKGRITVLAGRSGSGKTTVLRAVNRLNECLDTCRTEGRVTVSLSSGRMDVYAPDTDVEKLRRRVGMVFQTPAVLPVSIARNMLMPLELVSGLSRKAAMDRAAAALRDVGLFDEVADRLNEPAESLSGGQQQRLCLARALAMDPEILLLDEPTASVDPRSAGLIEDLLLSLCPKLTLVVVSHNLSQARKLADRLYLMREGSVVGQWDREDGESALEKLQAELT